MFALDYITSHDFNGVGDRSVHTSMTETPRSARSGSMASTIESITKVKPPRTEGQIKWLSTLNCDAEVMCVKFSPDGTLVAAGLSSGHIKIFTADGVPVYSLSDSDIIMTRLPCTQIQFIPHQLSENEDKRHVLLAIYASGWIKFWHYQSGKCIHTITEKRQCLCLGFKNSGEQFAVGGSDPVIHVYDTNTKQHIMKLEPSDSRDVMNGHRLRVFALQYHPTDPHMIISGGWDDTVQFWDDRTKHAVRRIYGPHICGDALDIDPVHNHLVTGSWRKNNVLQIWDIESGSKLKDVPQDALHKCMLYCCQWLGKDYIMCGGNDQNMARIIDRGTLNTVAQVFDLEQGVFCLDNDRQHALPKLVIGASTNVYLMKQEKRL